MNSASSRRFFAVLRDAASSPLLSCLRPRPPNAVTPPSAGPLAYLQKRSLQLQPSYPLRGFSFTSAPVWTPRSRYVVSRSFAGFCAWTTVPASSPAASPAVVEAATGTLDRGLGPSKLCRRSTAWGKVWTRGVHAARKARGGFERRQTRRSNSSASRAAARRNGSGSGSGSGNGGGKNYGSGKSANKATVEEHGAKKVADEKESHKWLPSIAHMHRPTKDEMLAAATGFFQRLRIRTKWSLIRQMRPYNWEDVSAFFSWLFIGHLLWIILGTTTFMSAAIFLINTVVAQETLAGTIGNYLTKETGVKVVFESAIVPRWKDGCISLKNVFVSRRPSRRKEHSNRNVRKGSPATAAAAAAAALNADAANPEGQHEEDDGNYTQFDLTLETVNVTLSFARWMNGKGLLKDVEVKGIRGVVDRRHVHWDQSVDPRSLKHEHHPGDFEIELFKLDDLLVTIHQPGGFRPFSVSIYSCDLPQLRKQWLFYDFLSANHVSGSYDDSLFTIHPRQSYSMDLNGPDSGRDNPWKKTSRLRIDGLEIDHLNRGVEGPFSWIQNGNVDIVADVMLPVDDDLDFSKVVQDIVERMEATVASRRTLSDPRPPPGPVGTEEQSMAKQKDHKFVIMDVRVQLNDVKAAVPLFNQELSYVNNALIRPIVAYINNRKTYIPINCRVVKRLSEFDGSWTIFDSGLMDDLSAETYEAFAKDVTSEQARRRRFKKVGLWSLQLAAQALLMGMAAQVA